MRKLTRQAELPDGRTVDAGFELDNRGKRSIAIAINRPEGAEIVRKLAERADNIVHWTEFDRGGHYPAHEVPDLLVGDLRRFFADRRN